MNITEQLMKLAELRAAGVLDDDEFESAKRSVLREESSDKGAGHTEEQLERQPPQPRSVAELLADDAMDESERAVVAALAEERTGRLTLSTLVGRTQRSRGVVRPALAALLSAGHVLAVDGGRYELAPGLVGTTAEETQQEAAGPKGSAGTALPPKGWMDDPSGRFAQRYWDGHQFTEWVATSSGETSQDPHSNPNSSSEPARSGSSKHEASNSGRGAATPAHSRGSQDVPFHAGDAVLGLLSKVTLNTWTSNRVAAAFGVPRLAEIVRERRGDPRPLLWLGIRLQEFERTNRRQKQSIVPASVEGLLLRPVTRFAANAISSGKAPASVQVLSTAWEVLNRRLVASPRSDEMCLMARAYLAGGAPDKAYEVAQAAAKADPSRSEAYYVAAEAAFDLQDFSRATALAHEAVSYGCTLGLALLRQDSPFRRHAWVTTEKTHTMPTANDFWSAKMRYFDGATTDQLFHFFGPSPLSPEGA